MSSFQFERTERFLVDWPVLRTVDDGGVKP